ncbi:MAG: N-6 DNA methylase [Methanoregulaceae archaeon]|nr:N-6 DNA methylase [Methanoregulaceae archaeon]
MKTKNSIKLSRDFENLLDDTEGGKISTRRRANGTKRQTSGAFFTPPGLVAYSVKISLDEYFKNLLSKDDPDILTKIENLKIIDPAVGSGLFLLGCRQYLREELPKLLARKNIRLHNEQIRKTGIKNSDASYIGSEWDRWIVHNILWGIDINSDALKVCRYILQSGFKEEIPKVNLLEANTLSSPIESLKEWLAQKSKAKKWNLVIGNPPWGTEIPPNSNSEYSHCKGESALAFCEIAHELTNGNGIISFILPSSWLEASSWRVWREKNLSKLRLNKIFILPYSTFPSAAFTSPPMIGVFGLNSNSIQCQNLILQDDSHSGVINGALFPNLDEYCHNVTIKKINQIKSDEVKDFPGNRIPLASQWWIDNFFKNRESHDSINNHLKELVRGVKTGNNARYIKLRLREEVQDFQIENLNGFSGESPQWTWLAKGGAAKVKGKPTYFLQPKNHIIRWDSLSVQEYKKSNGLRNSQYYGKTGVGFGSSGKNSPIFRLNEMMVFDADYIVLIPNRTEDNYFLLCICNSPAFLYAAKNLYNHSLHFKAADLSDMHFPKISFSGRQKLIDLAQQMLIALIEKNPQKEFHLFNTMHKMLVEEWSIPTKEEERCVKWYIERFPGMKPAFT